MPSGVYAANTLVEESDQSFVQPPPEEVTLPDTALYVSNAATRPTAVHAFIGMKTSEMDAAGANAAQKVTMAIAAAASIQA